ncbi:malonate transporter subunit MadL [Methylobacterium sp. A49B]
MIVLGVALLAACTLIGVYLGDLLGLLLGVKANVGGVGIAMILLIAARLWLSRRGRLTKGVQFGVEFWAGMYIPIVVAMAAQQNVVAAVSGGPIVLIAATGSLVLCFGAVALLSRVGRRDASTGTVEHGGSVIGGGTEPPVPVQPASSVARKV